MAHALSPGDNLVHSQAADDGDTVAEAEELPGSCLALAPSTGSLLGFGRVWRDGRAHLKGMRGALLQTHCCRACEILDQNVF